jgi:endonuclease/exonuclease/phosphatase (EEP) superfamily protein YafD
MEFIIIFSIVSVVASFVPITGSDFWLIRGQDYFKQAYLLLNSILLVLLLTDDVSGWLETLVVIGLILSILYCLKQIIPFTRMFSKEIHDAESTESMTSLKLLIFNVLQSNSNYSALIELVESHQADIILLVETNSDWAGALLPLDKSYPFHSKEIKENTYGMMVLSRIPIKDCEVRYLVRNDVPSMHVQFNFHERTMHLFALHPKPPVPSELLHARQKDRELFKAALIIKSLDRNDLVIVAGDLNDVAWSKASRRLKKMTGLKDPRTGRGLYATFPSYFPLKIPIDQIFCSDDWLLKEFIILENIGSDHHPLFIDLALA